MVVLVGPVTDVVPVLKADEIDVDVPSGAVLTTVLERVE